MSAYQLTNDFTKLSETACVLYAIPGGGDVEISDTQTEDSGFILREGKPFAFAAPVIYARAVGAYAALNAVSCKMPVY